VASEDTVVYKQIKFLPRAGKSEVCTLRVLSRLFHILW